MTAALASWLAVVPLMSRMDTGPGADLGSFPLFVGVWVTMTAAIMLPAALPMVLLFERVGRGKRAAGGAAPPTWLFVASYLAVWTLVGAAAYGADRALGAAASSFLAWHRHGPLVAGLAVAAAGVYELTPLKRACLGHCRSPMHYVLGGWRPGRSGAVRMGAGHGLACVGCCWALMVVLFAVGVTSVFWMTLVTAVIVVEKALPRGEGVPWLVAATLVALGVWMIVEPGSVPYVRLPGAG